MSRLARIPALLAVACAVAVDAAWNVQLTGARLLDEDAAIYWFAAREFARLRFREPFFYGQAYNHLGESLLAAPAVALGVSPWIALPAVSMLLGVAAWAVLAWIAWRRGAHALAVLLLGAPLLFPAGYAILQQRYFGTGLLLETLGLLTLEAAPSRARAALAGFLLALGAALLPNAALLAAVGVAWVATRREAAVPWRWLLLGAGGAVLLYGLGRAFYVLDPAWAVHPAPALGADWRLLVSGIADLPRHMARVTPRAFLHPGLMLGATAAVAVAAAARRRWAAAAPAAALVALALLALSFSKVHEGSPSVLFAFDRMFLGLPLALGVVAVAAAGAGVWTGGRSARAVGACVVVVLGTAAWRWGTLAADVAAEQADQRSVLNVGEVHGAVVACAAAERAARAEGTDLVLFLAHRTLAYACGAISYDRVTTLYPHYERRTWLIRAEARRPRDVLVIPDLEVDSGCETVLREIPGASCGSGAAGFLVVRMPPMTAVDFARTIGVPVRNF